MRAGAQLQTVIEIIDCYNPDLGPLDEYSQTYLRQRRYIGSHDRRQINHDLFRIYRLSPFLQKAIRHVHMGTVNGRNLVLSYLRWYVQKSREDISDLFTGQPYHPRALSDQEIRSLTHSLDFSTTPQFCFPDWLFEKLSNVYKQHTEEELTALDQQAAVDICVNTRRCSRDDVLKDFKNQGIIAEKTPYSPFGLRLQKRVDLRPFSLFKQGIIDIQDEGSQLICILSDIKPDMTVCDYCAGVGGKTRTLSLLLENQGTLIATDTSGDRLEKLQSRLKGRHYANVKIEHISEVHKSFPEAFDRVLLDVPCSGTGRFRRQPELKMTLSLEKLDNYILMQRQILKDAAHLVKTKGYLIYATCSLLQEENEMQIEWFLNHNPGFKVIPSRSVLKELKDCRDYLRLTPYTHGTDGFFAALLQRD